MSIRVSISAYFSRQRNGLSSTIHDVFAPGQDCFAEREMFDASTVFKSNQFEHSQHRRFKRPQISK